MEQYQSESAGVVGLIFMAVYCLVVLVNLIAWWKIFSKAEQPGWGILVPFLNIYLMVKVAGRPGLWFVLALIPFVNIVTGIIMTFDIAKRFGKGTGFGVGMLLLAPIFYPMLAFSDAEYELAIEE